jgi:phosphoglucomutase
MLTEIRLGPSVGGAGASAGARVATVHDYRAVRGGARRHRMITCEKLCEPRCVRLERRSALPTDGDADGTVMQPNAITAILFDSQIDRRGWPNGVAKSVAPADLIHALAGKRGVERTGLRSVLTASENFDSSRTKVRIDGGDSGGLSIRHPLPGKDGIVAGYRFRRMPQLETGSRRLSRGKRSVIKLVPSSRLGRTSD